MTPRPSSRNLARELTGLATEVDSLTKSLVRVQEELASELKRRQHFEREAVDLATAVAQARQRATVAERELARLAAELDTKTQTAQVREHELQTRLTEANQTVERLQRELESKERQRLALETDLSDVMQNLRHAAAEVAWPSRTPAESTTRLADADSEPTQVGW
jgi:chromosome segregation ATPase